MFDFFRKKGNNSDDSADSNAPQSSEGAAVGRTTRDVLTEFTATPLPDAIDGLLFRVSMADPADPASSSGFDAYAARLLSDAEAPNLRAIAVEHPVELRRLNTTGLFWSIFDDSTISAGNRSTILRIESVLDRLALISKSLEGDEGTAYVSATTEGACSELDWQVLRSIANDANEYLTAADRDNKLDTQYGTTGTRGGNWDLSTRFASACEAMVLPFRLEYRFACDSHSGTIIADISLPTPDVFPKSRFNAATGQWADCTAQRPAAAAAYALRLAALIASAAFGASVGVTRVVVNGKEGSIAGATVLSLEFGRIPFTMGAMTKIRSGEFAAPATECDPAALFDMLHLAQFAANIDDAGIMQPVDPLDVSLTVPYTPVADDDRPLPDDLRALLHADTVRELDVMSEQDADLAARYRAIMEEKDDSLLLAVAQLEDIVAETDKLALGEVELDELAKPSESRRILYCENVFARYLTSLVESDPSVRYARASDIGQAARSSLSRIYRDMGDLDAAEAQARICIDLAPTSAPAYNDLITCFAEGDHYDKIVEVAKEALRVAVTGNDISYVYYRLAFAYWQTGRLNEALACYLRVPESSPMGEAALRERNDLVSEMGNNVPGNEWDPTACLRTAGVPLAPLDDVMEVVGRALIELCDANMPLAAAPLASLVASTQRNDVLHAVAASLRNGV
ncbi:tetratricopeptide repeat protein [Adlercreutzia sp. R25]|uniref:Tetratricopeptide repeat protein n=1 Tax=Adlercreutzia shanghongiae TaxID=3111773 RepID=A0ABU6J280_9ACTN|nr:MULTISPECIES: tetratricopeptide repeat protein [unclassified Adlercreutzia]MEC4273586.1 tetratricopeptide repeat protein [Adlercreutzia sp. R25]MEC4295912.1 tetratricopeptide repeat protein [Adlercreutzia sp. R22]